MKNFKTFLDGLSAAQATREIKALSAEIASGGDGKFARDLLDFVVAYTMLHPEVRVWGAMR